MRSVGVSLGRLTSRSDVRLLLAIVLVGAIVRFVTLDVQSTWTDELASASYVRGGLKEMLIGLSREDGNPPLFYLLEWFFVRVFGQGDVGLRVLPALCGTLTLPVLYAIGSTVASRRAGLLAAALGAFQPMLWWYSQEARNYALFTLLSAVALLAFVVALRDRSAWSLALWTLFSGLMLTAHYFALFLIMPQAAWLVAEWLGRRREVFLALAGLAVVAVGLAATFALETLPTRSIGLTPRGPRLRVLVPQLLTSPSPPAALLWIAALALVLGGVALALLTTPPPARRLARVLAVLAAWDLAAPVIAALTGHDYITTRNLIGTLVPLLVVVGIGFASPAVPRVGIACVALTAALWLGAVIAIVAQPGLQRIDAKSALASLGPPTVNRVVLTPGGFLFSRVAPRYLTHAAPFASSKVPVQEIDVLVPHPGRGTRPCWAGQTCELFSTHQRPGPPAPGFRLVGRNEVEPFTVVRWRAPASLRLQLSDLVASAPTHRLFPPLALYQTPQPVTTIRPPRPTTPRGGGGSPAAASQQNLQLADLPPGWSVAPPQGVAKQVFACLHALPANQTSESVLNAAGPPGRLTVTSDVLTWRNRAAAERADRALRGSGGASCVGYALGLSLRRLAPKASGAARPVAAPIGAGRRALAYRGSIRANGVLAQGTTVYLTRGSRSALLLGFSVGRGVFPAPLLSKLAATLARRMSAAPPAR